MSRIRKNNVDNLGERLARFAADTDLEKCRVQLGDPRYLAILEQMRVMHIAKSADYGNGKKKDPLANLRASSRFGVPPWVGAVVRLNDKVTRIESFIENGSLKNESIEDSFMDIAAYAILALLLFRERQSPDDAPSA